MQEMQFSAEKSDLNPAGLHALAYPHGFSNLAFSFCSFRALAYPPGFSL